MGYGFVRWIIRYTSRDPQESEDSPGCIVKIIVLGNQCYQGKRLDYSERRIFAPELERGEVWVTWFV
jgi:hypothetical protein